MSGTDTTARRAPVSVYTEDELDGVYVLLCEALVSIHDGDGGQAADWVGRAIDRLRLTQVQA
jgi:hypothetical protein